MIFRCFCCAVSCEKTETTYAEAGLFLCEDCSAYPKSVTLLAATRDSSQISVWYLAVSRPNRPTEFGLPGGKVDPGETFTQAIIRETKEETGLNITSADVFPIFAGICEGEVTYLNVTFGCESASGALHTDEPLVIAWVKRGDLELGPFGHYNTRLFKHLAARPSPDEGA